MADTPRPAAPDRLLEHPAGNIPAEATTQPAPRHPTDGPVHTHFELTRATHDVWPRTLLQSMPLDWQAQYVRLHEQLRAAFAHLQHPEGYGVYAATEHEIADLTPAQLAAAGCSREQTQIGDDDHGRRYYYRYYDQDGHEVEPDHRVLLRCPDPIPHYNRGRTYIEPKFPTGDGVVHTNPTRFTVTALPEDASPDAWHFAVQVEYRGDGKWAAGRHGEYGPRLTADGQWATRGENEDCDMWIARTRHDLDVALTLAEEAAPHVTVNGYTVADVLAMAERRRQQ